MFLQMKWEVEEIKCIIYISMLKVLIWRCVPQYLKLNGKSLDSSSSTFKNRLYAGLYVELIKAVIVSLEMSDICI